MGDTTYENSVVCFCSASLELCIVEVAFEAVFRLYSVL